MDRCPLSRAGVGVVRLPGDRDAERSRAGSNNKEVRGGQRVRGWKDRGVMKLQRVFPAKSVVGIKSCLAANENFAVERWIICNLDQLRSSTTGYLRSPSPYHPHGAAIFPNPPNKKRAMKTEIVQNKKHAKKESATKERRRIPPSSIPVVSFFKVQTPESPVQKSLNRYRRHRSLESQGLCRRGCELNGLGQLRGGIDGSAGRSQAL